MKLDREFFELVVQNVNDGVLVVQDGRIQFANRPLLEMGGYDESDVLGEPLTTPIAPSDRERVRERYERRMRGEDVPERYELTLITKDGAERPYEINVSIIDYGGEPAVLAVLRDISVRKERETKLEQAREELQELFDSVPDLIFLHSADGGVYAVNDAAAETLGYTKEELKSMTTGAICPAAEEKLASVRAEMDEREEWTFECVLLTKDGGEIPVEMHTTPIPHDGGHALISVARDIRARREEQQKFQRVIEQSRDGITVIQDGRLQLVNPALCEMTGYTEAELTGKPFTTLLPPGERERIRERHEARRRGEDVPEKYEITICSKDGEKLPTEVHVGEVQYEGERAFVTIVRDITERKEKEEALRRVERQLREKERIVERLHEVTRNLIQADSKEEGAELIVDAANRLLGFPLTGVRFLDEAGEMLVPVAITEEGTAVRGEPPAYDVDEDYAGKAYREGTWVCDDVTEMETHHGRGAVQSVMYVPIEGHGVISVGSVEEDAFDERDVKFAEVLAANAKAAFDRIDSESELKKARARLEEAQRVANIGHWEWDIESAELDWSDEMFRILGLEPGEIAETYDRFFDYVHPDDRAKIQAAVEEALEENNYSIDHRIVRPDGEVRIVHERADVSYESGEPVRMLGTMQDVTRERRLEQMLDSLREIDRKILQAEDEESLFESTREVFAARERYGCAAIGVLDRQGALDAIYDVGKLADTAEQCEREWQRIYTDEYVQRALEEGVVVLDDVTGPPHHHHPADVESHGAIVLGLTYRGNDYGVLTLHLPPEGVPDRERQILQEIANDIAVGVHALRAEERIERENEELALLNRIVRHDIRNDMTVVLGFAEMLHTEVPPENREDVERILGTSRHTVELTKTARDLVEMIRSEEAPKVRPVALAPALTDEFENTARSYPRATFELGDVPDVMVQGNDLLPAVFRNLLHNAVQHNDKDEPQVEVTVDERRESVVVSVADNGPGVPDDQKEEIFGRGEKGLESPGTGMGLYFVTTLVEQYGGEVWVEDNDPEGAIFSVDLPTAESEGE